MAFIRTLVCVIFLIFSLSSCTVVECVYEEQYWELHTIHFELGMDVPGCYYCEEYNKIHAIY